MAYNTDPKPIPFLLGEYFFELDDKSILPGYPKLIQDVWGMSGPIDAAFTRLNCQGKSYIFKVEMYTSLESVSSKHFNFIFIVYNVQDS